MIMNDDTSTSSAPATAEQPRHFLNTREIWEPLGDAKEIPRVLTALFQAYPPSGELKTLIRRDGYLPLELGSPVINLIGTVAKIKHPGLMIVPTGDASIDIWWLRESSPKRLTLQKRPVFGDISVFRKPEPVLAVDYHVSFGATIVRLDYARHTIGWTPDGELIQDSIARIVIPDLETLKKVQFVQTAD